MAKFSPKYGVILLLWVAALLSIVYFWLSLRDNPTGQLHTDLGKGDYHLETTAGEPFTEASLKGHPSAVFFGFTHCPDVCPTTLGDIQLWQQRLGARADALQVYFITVDPERDTVENLKDYVGWLDNAVGVSGSVEEIEKAKSAFRVFSQKVPLSDGQYTVDHTAYVMLFDDKGDYFGVLAYQEPIERALPKLEALLGS